MDRVNGAGTVDIGDGRRGFADEDLDVGREGTEVTALWLNMLQEEILKIIEVTGEDPSHADWTQLAKAIQTGRLNYAVAGGGANALTASLAPAPASLDLIVGAPIRILTTSSPTGAATLNLNGLGARSIIKRGGRAIVDGEWISGDIIELVYDGTAFRMVAAQRSGLDTAGFVSYGVSPVLTVADCGRYVNLNLAASSCTLPKSSNCPDGAVISLHNTRAGTSVTVNAAAGDDVTLGVLGAGAGQTSFVMQNQESVLLVNYKALNNWVAVSGSTQARFTPGFESTLGGGIGNPAVKRIPDKNSPSGFVIIQSGVVSSISTANTNLPVSFNLAFPNAVCSIHATPISVGTRVGASNNASSLTNFNIWGDTVGGAAFWFAWGY